jgi:lysozyme
MASTVEVSNETVEFVKSWEGFSATAYYDVSRWSVGYGTVGYEGETVTEAEAAKRLQEVVETYADKLARKLTFEPTPSQTTGLLSAAYNLGVGGISKITIACNSGEFQRAADMLRLYDHAGGKRLPALTRRREAEAALLERDNEVHTMRGEPRVQYERTYYLMPPDASKQEFMDIAGEVYNQKATIGFSADDAGIGDLENRNVVLVHPERQPAQLTEWFLANYEATKILHHPKEHFVAPELPVGLTKVGLHGSADGSWGNPILPETIELIKEAKIEAYKGLSNESANTVKILKDINPDMFILIRLFAKVNKGLSRPQQFIDTVAQDAVKWYHAGVRHFEVHNEPNLKIDDSAEGMWDVWEDGGEFSLWFLQVVAQLKEMMPEAQFGYPGLSPGIGISGVRYDPIRFFNESWTAVDEADFICAHCYWVTRDQIYSDDHGQWYKRYHVKNKPIMITEFSNPSHEVPKGEKGKQYVEYYASLDNVHSAFSFLSTASSGFQHETWHGSNIATTVGQRDGS